MAGWIDPNRPEEITPERFLTVNWDVYFRRLKVGELLPSGGHIASVQTIFRGLYQITWEAAHSSATFQILSSYI